VTGDDDRILAALGRAAVYRLLARTFAHPTPARIGEVAGAAQAIAARTDGPVGWALTELAAVARETHPVAAATEFAALFAGEARCPPYEGAYHPAPLAGTAVRLTNLGGFYRAFGLAPGGPRPESEDHIGAELEFMSTLVLREAHALAGHRAAASDVMRAAEATFLTDHLGCWAGAFAVRLRQETALPYLWAAAALLALWVDLEVTALGATPARVGSRPAGAGREGPCACPLAPRTPPV
jgi:putative dimethyl sulfoxide reductase chaperone